MTPPISVSAPSWTLSGRYALNRTSGRPRAKSVVAWPRAPGGAEPEALARAAPALAAGEQRRDRREVVRVGRVAKPEQQRDDRDDQQRRPVRESQPVPMVEPEHRVSFLDDSRQGAHGHDETEHEDDRGAERR